MAGKGDIAIIGFGSLIWELDDLAPRVVGNWMLGAGPSLPLEFTRVSRKRHGALTVVIDHDHGAPCTTHVIRSRRDSLLRAVVDLALRERASPAQIGYAAARPDSEAEAEQIIRETTEVAADWPDIHPGPAQAASPEIAARVRDWCRDNGWRGAVWTDLPSNYTEKTGESFAIQGAEHYLAGLTGAAATGAVRYITEAPAATDTPLRRHLATRAWWQTSVDALSRAG
ncbi:MAG: hypothetical protein AAF577_12975 [Pseudomonadota bacterium]